SILVRAATATRSPFSSPSSRNPAATSSARRPASSQLTSVHRSRSWTRYAGKLQPAAVASRQSPTIVPAVTAGSLRGGASAGTIRRVHGRSAEHPFDVVDVKSRLAAGNGGYEIVHTSPGLEVGVYVLAAPEPDRQQPHEDDEVYVVLEGHGVLSVED